MQDQVNQSEKLIIHCENILCGLTGEFRRGFLLINNEKFEKLIGWEDWKGKEQQLINLYQKKGYKFIDFFTQYLTPGIIELNCSLNCDVDDTDWEDIENVTLTGLSGGVTCVVNSPLMSGQKTIYEVVKKIEILQKKSLCDFAQLGLLDPTISEEQLKKQEPYIVGRKTYLSRPLQNFCDFSADDEQLSNVFQKIRNIQTKLPVFVHTCKQQNDKDLQITSPFRKLQPIDRLENKNNEFLGDYYLPDGVQGEKLDKLYGYESEFKMNQSEEEKQYMKKFMSIAYTNSKNNYEKNLSIKMQSQYRKSQEKIEEQSKSQEEIEEGMQSPDEGQENLDEEDYNVFFENDDINFKQEFVKRQYQCIYNKDSPTKQKEDSPDEKKRSDSKANNIIQLENIKEEKESQQLISIIENKQSKYNKSSIRFDSSQVHQKEGIEIKEENLKNVYTKKEVNYESDSNNEGGEDQDQKHLNGVQQQFKNAQKVKSPQSIQVSEKEKSQFSHPVHESSFINPSIQSPSTVNLKLSEFSGKQRVSIEFPRVKDIQENLGFNQKLVISQQGQILDKRKGDQDGASSEEESDEDFKKVEGRQNQQQENKFQKPVQMKQSGPGLNRGQQLQLNVGKKYSLGLNENREKSSSLSERRRLGSVGLRIDSKKGSLTESDERKDSSVSSIRSRQRTIQWTQRQKDQSYLKDYQTYLAMRPPFWEHFAVAQISKYLGKMLAEKKESDLKLKIVFQNVSCAHTLGKIYALKNKIYSQKIQILCEYALPYLIFDQDNCSCDQRFKNETPLQNLQNKKLCFSILDKNYVIDLVSAYNFPVPTSYKIIDEPPQFKRTFNGFYSIGASFQALWSLMLINILKQPQLFESSIQEINQKRNKLIKIKIQQICQLHCSNPAQAINIQNQKGSIRPGLDADFIVWNPQEIFSFIPMGVQKEEHEKIRPDIHIFYKRKLYGNINKTYIRGQLVFLKTSHNDLKISKTFQPKIILPDKQ